MYLGLRKIRSAGRTSGSIEITLPTDLHILEGVECRLVVRDGPNPEIILQPELSVAQRIFEELWRKLQLGYAEIGDIGHFASEEFSLALFPPRHWQTRPPLAYSDALVVAQSGNKAHVKAPEALARLLAFLSLGAIYRLGLKAPLALAFADATAHLMTGVSAGLGGDFERGLAHRVFWGDRASQDLGSALDDAVWRKAAPGLYRVCEQFRIWQRDPKAYTNARDTWYRALRLELGVRPTHTGLVPDNGDVAR
jgi:hypothetical protein